MPYLFGIYLLYSSFVFLYFADRMPHVARTLNESVAKACESIIRAHEISTTTLSVKFQRDFRKVLRITLNYACRHVQSVSRYECDFADG